MSCWWPLEISKNSDALFASMKKENSGFPSRIFPGSLTGRKGSGFLEPKVPQVIVMPKGGWMGNNPVPSLAAEQVREAVS
jgi:hypothetical protein